jgi:hypothetical protein
MMSAVKGPTSLKEPSLSEGSREVGPFIKTSLLPRKHSSV